MREFLNTLYKKIRNFLLCHTSKEFLIFLFFFFLAAFFWLLQTLSLRYETRFKIPVRVKNVPSSVVITSENIPSVQVLVKDRGWQLVNYRFFKTFYPLVIAYNKYPKHTSHIVVRSESLLKDIQKQFDSSTDIISVSPDSISCYFCKGEAKKLPVKLNAHINLLPNYYLRDTMFLPDSVLVYAPEEKINKIQFISTLPVSYHNVSDSIRARLLLDVPEGVKVNPEKVNVLVSVDQYTEKEVSVPVVGIGFPKNKILRTFPSKVKVTFKVGLQDFKKIKAEDFSLVVDYNELSQSKSNVCNIKLMSIPNGVKAVRLSPNHVDYLIEQINDVQ